MKKFAMREIREAIEYAGAGGQALHVHTLSGGHRLFARYPEIAHLFDQDLARLRNTATRLGVKIAKVERMGEAGQHVDLCGMPFVKALAECEVGPEWAKATQEMMDGLL